MTLQPGPTNSLTDLEGLRVGHHTANGDGYLTGTTVIVGEADGFVAGVDVRGGAPGSHETDLLDPMNAVQRIHALVLGGGSAFGLAAIEGVQNAMRAQNLGLTVMPGITVPIVPGAIIFDLGRSGTVTSTPDATFGVHAFEDAMSDAGSAKVRTGSIGGGTGAMAGGIKGGVGSASVVLENGTTVAALVVLNSVGSAINTKTGEIYGAAFGLPGEFDSLKKPSQSDIDNAPPHMALLDNGLFPDVISLNTTIAFLATDATLTKAECKKLAGIGQDGLARAIHPVHTMFDGDTVFGGSTSKRPAPSPLEFHHLLTVAADCMSRAIAHALLDSAAVSTPAIALPNYLEIYPSAK